MLQQQNNGDLNGQENKMMDVDDANANNDNNNNKQIASALNNFGGVASGSNVVPNVNINNNNNNNNNGVTSGGNNNGLSGSPQNNSLGVGPLLNYRAGLMGNIYAQNLLQRQIQLQQLYAAQAQANILRIPPPTLRAPNARLILTPTAPQTNPLMLQQQIQANLAAQQQKQQPQPQMSAAPNTNPSTNNPNNNSGQLSQIQPQSETNNDNADNTKE